MVQRALVVMTLLTLAGLAPGQDVLPYVGQINARDVNIRSGNSLNYYPVLRLSTPARVTVVGQTGDWLMIAPPAGAYSLISKRFVDLEGDVGTITGTGVVVRAGSDLHPEKREKVQTSLNRGDRVTVLGEADDYYKVAPPRGVVLYVSDQFVDRINEPVAEVGFEAPAAVDAIASPPTATTAPALPAPATPPAVPATAEPAATEEPTVPPAAPRPSADASLSRLERWKLAEQALMAEYEKPIDQRNLAELMEMYQDVAQPADDAIGQRAAYRMRFLRFEMDRLDSRGLADQLRAQAMLEQQQMETERTLLRRQEPIATPIPVYSLIGRLVPSAAFPGEGGIPKRWTVRDDEGQILAYAESASLGTLGSFEGWKVELTGQLRYDRDLRARILDVNRIERIPGGEPLPQPERSAMILPPSPAPPAIVTPTTQPAEPMAARAYQPSPKPDFGPAQTQPAMLPPVELPMAPGTQPTDTPVNLREYE